MPKPQPTQTTERTAVYVLGPVTFLPHYNRPGVFVAPGYRTTGHEYSQEELTAMGAKRRYEQLWPRSET